MALTGGLLQDTMDIERKEDPSGLTKDEIQSSDTDKEQSTINNGDSQEDEHGDYHRSITPRQIHVSTDENVSKTQ